MSTNIWVRTDPKACTDQTQTTSNVNLWVVVYPEALVLSMMALSWTYFFQAVSCQHLDFPALLSSSGFTYSCILQQLEAEANPQAILSFWQNP